MLPPLATVADLETRLGVAVGSLAGADLARAVAALDDASALIRDEARADWVAEDGTVTAPRAIVRVAVEVARRDYSNPERLVGESIGGAYSSQRTPEEVTAYLTATESAIVRRAAGRVGQVTSVRTPSAYAGPGPVDDPLSELLP